MWSPEFATHPLRLAASLCALTVLLSAPLYASGQTTDRASLNSLGTEANAESNFASASDDGRYVAFISFATNLVPDDTNDRFDVFVHDRNTGATERVSVSDEEEESNGSSFVASISGDGRYVAFVSSASNLVANDTNGLQDVFVRDRHLGTTQRVSVSSTGEQGTGSASLDFADTAISGDGRHVVFVTGFSNLVPNDTNGVPDVFVRDLDLDRTERVNLSSTGAQAQPGSSVNALLLPAVISRDGRYVAFMSGSPNLTPDDQSPSALNVDVFVRDRSAATTELVNRTSDGAQAHSVSPFVVDSLAISDDGRHVVFNSDAANLAIPAGAPPSVFIRDLDGGLTERIDVGATENILSGGTAVSADGRYVLFGTSSPGLVPDDTNQAADYFVRDRVAGTTERVSVSSFGGQGRGDLERFVGACDLSPDGRYAAFQSRAFNLVGGDTNGVGDVFMRDRLGPVLTQPTRLELTPEQASVPLGTEHCVVARATDAAQAPVPGLPIAFEVAGNTFPAGRIALGSDASGEARFCYFVATTPERNTITATASSRGAPSDTALVDVVDPTPQPEQPTALTLTPETLTATVGTQACLTARVTDAQDRPLGAVSVAFAVSSAEPTRVATDAQGQAAFCYVVAELPGVDRVTASAESGSQPSDVSTVTRTVPPNSRGCLVEWSGALVTQDGATALLRGDAFVSRGTPRAAHRYREIEGGEARVDSVATTGVFCQSRSASVFGTARTELGEIVIYRLDLVDGGSRRGRYRLRLDDGTDTGSQRVFGGSVLVDP